MKKEHIKSFILILLILNAVQLMLHIWFDNNLWKSENGFYDSIKNSPFVTSVFSIFGKDKDTLTGEQLYAAAIKPRRIIINGGGAREVYNIESEEYSYAEEKISSIIDSFRKSNITVTNISYSEWKNLFKGKSIYVDFGYGIDADNLNIIYDIASSDGKFEKFTNSSGFIITPDTFTSTCTICMYDQNNDSVVAHSFSYNGGELLKYIEESTYGKQQNDMFAFEINLDTKTVSDEDVERRVALNPLSLLSIGNEKSKTIKFNNIFENYDEIERFSEKALSVFGYNASNLRKTVLSDNTIVYVENNATIKYYYDGTIEYTSVKKDIGMKTTSANQSCSSTVNDILNIVKSIWDKSGVSSDNLILHMDSILADNKDNIYVIKLNNLYNGTVINYDNLTNNAVYAEVEDGYITKFIMHISDVKETESANESIPVLQGIDM
ncbi:MAG: hypothetical protein IJQ28_00840, partial [Clostridia bacterium]|nr:hypothetical protein [Clostridia bacterium]